MIINVSMIVLLLLQHIVLVITLTLIIVHISIANQAELAYRNLLVACLRHNALLVLQAVFVVCVLVFFLILSLLVLLFVL